MTGILCLMGTTKNKSKTENGKKQSRRRGSGPMAFFIALFIVALGAIQLVATFHSYALNLAELNGLKRQEAALVAQKQNLENDISRWNDNAYVTAQARDRLGFVFLASRLSTSNIPKQSPVSNPNQTTPIRTRSALTNRLCLGTANLPMVSRRPTNR